VRFRLYLAAYSNVIGAFKMGDPVAIARAIEESSWDPEHYGYTLAAEVGRSSRDVRSCSRGAVSGGDAMRVTVVGAGYVGATSAVVLAYLGHRVTCLEHDARDWQTGAAGPIRFTNRAGGSPRKGEPAFRRRRERPGVRRCHRRRGRHSHGRAGLPDLSQLDGAAAEISARAREGALVIIRSTVRSGPVTGSRRVH